MHQIETVLDKELCHNRVNVYPEELEMTTNPEIRNERTTHNTKLRNRFSVLEPLEYDSYYSKQAGNSKGGGESAGENTSSNNRSSIWTIISVLIYYPLHWLGITYLLKLLFRNLPFRTTSRLVGKIARVRLPYWMREPVFRTYGWLFNVQLGESEYRDDLSKYDTISAFFRRRLVSSARIVDPSACLVSPADGTVLSCGLVKAGHLEQVKGIFYSLNGLLGPNTWGNMTQTSQSDDIKTELPQLRPARSTSELAGEYMPCVTSEGLDYLPVVSVEMQDHELTGQSQEGKRRRSSCAISHSLRLQDMLYAEGLLLDVDGNDLMNRTFDEQSPHNRHHSCYSPTERKCMNPTNDLAFKQKTGLYHLLIYLAPGDYHRFHSPTEWSIFMRRHFPGKLYPVSPKFLPHCNGLYCVNERVIYIGRWTHGFFAYVAVGATNVGSIEVDLDPDLITNVPTKRYKSKLSSGRNSAAEDLPSNSQSPLYFDQYFGHITQRRGEQFGEFNFGSTVILIFEAPLNSFQFTVKDGNRIKVGESVGTMH